MITKSIKDLKLTQTFNLGTNKGSRILKKSLKLLGCCRSIVVDRNDNVLCGNKVVNAAKECGITRVRMIETTGDELIVVKRTDIDYETRKAKEIALVDNLTSEQNTNFDANLLLDTMNKVLGFDPRNWEGHSCLVQELSVEDCIKEGLAAVERKKNSETDTEEDVIQLSLF